MEQDIFKKGSTTYYWSSKFFPKSIRADVFDLYSFVRVADDYVDQVPADTEQFTKLRTLYEQEVGQSNFDSTRVSQDELNTRVVKNMIRVSRKYNFDPQWAVAFLDAMQSDIDSKPCITIEDTCRYMYGSAEVIGLMMARIMGLPDAAQTTAKLQGRAMQMINFIRDINEDLSLGRQYIPVNDIKACGLDDLSKESAMNNPEGFRKCIQLQLDRYEDWQHQAYAGYEYIPKRLQIPLRTATDMYNWTASQIAADPIVVYEKKVKPSKGRVIRRIARNII